MNARQKAKMYKKRYELLEKQLLSKRKSVCEVQHLPVVTLRATQAICKEDLKRFSEIKADGMSYVNKNIAAELFSKILDYSIVNRHDEIYSDIVVFEGIIKVVDMRPMKETWRNKNEN